MLKLDASEDPRAVRGRRPVERLIVECASLSPTGTNVSGHLLPGTKTEPIEDPQILYAIDWLAKSLTRLEMEAMPVGAAPWEDVRHIPQPTRFEVYADSLDDVLVRVRHDIDVGAYTQARARCLERIHEAIHADRKTLTIIKNKTPEKRREWIALHFNNRPEHELTELFGRRYRGGMPPLTVPVVVHPKTDERVTIRVWRELPIVDQRDWLIGAPKTPSNEAERNADLMGNTIARAMERFMGNLAQRTDDDAKRRR